MADWARLANTTINEYLRGEEVQVMRNRKILALLQDRGRVTFNHNGLLLDWKIRYRRAPLRASSTVIRCRSAARTGGARLRLIGVVMP